MNCFYHPNQPAVTTCTDCGKGLCTQCARRTQPIVCPDCFNKIKKNNIRSNTFSLIIFGVVFIVGYNIDIMQDSRIEAPWISGYVMLSIAVGWDFLSHHLPFRLTTATFLVWGIYLCLKLILSGWIGLILTPFVIIKKIYNIARYKQMHY